jgi:hypothetical protein
MTIQDDVIHCDCKNCLMHCRVPSNVFGTGDEGEMRLWAHNNAKGGDIGAQGYGGHGGASVRVKLNWNVLTLSDGVSKDTVTSDFCSNACATSTCGHGHNLRSEPTKYRRDPGDAKHESKTWRERMQRTPKPKPEPKIVAPIGRMK